MKVLNNSFQLILNFLHIYPHILIRESRMRLIRSDSKNTGRLVGIILPLLFKRLLKTKRGNKA
ncbi:hypothetical protein AGMMS50249_5650 [candidate division SR1 bacterium]|nr:hypothetical protein AGMMS50249_5650 [candidate division SR1 bacterium]